MRVGLRGRRGARGRCVGLCAPVRLNFPSESQPPFEIRPGQGRARGRRGLRGRWLAASRGEPELREEASGRP